MKFQIIFHLISLQLVLQFTYVFLIHFIPCNRCNQSYISPTHFDQILSSIIVAISVTIHFYLVATKQQGFKSASPQNSNVSITIYHKIAQILLFFTTKQQRFYCSLPQNCKDFICLYHKIAKLLTTKIAKIANKNRKKVIFLFILSFLDILIKNFKVLPVF